MPSQLAAGSLLWQQGDAGSAAVLLIEGTLEVIAETEDGDVLVLRVLQPGSLLGEMSALEGVAHSATVRAGTPCQLRTVPATQLRALLAAHPELWEALLRLQSERVRALSEQVSVLAFDGVTRRVARHLVHEVDPASPQVRATHQEIAERVAATRESVTKALGGLARAGALNLRRGVIEVADLDVLRQLAD